MAVYNDVLVPKKPRHRKSFFRFLNFYGRFLSGPFQRFRDGVYESRRCGWTCRRRSYVPVLSQLEDRLAPAGGVLAQADPANVSGGFDATLGRLHDAFDDAISTVGDLPLIGAKLQDAVQPLADKLDSSATQTIQLVNSLFTQVASDPNANASTIFQNGLFRIFGPQGLNILKDGPDPGTNINVSDVFVTQGADLNGQGNPIVGTEWFQWNLVLGQHLTIDVPLDLSVALPPELQGIGFKLETNGGLRVNTDWNLNLGFGVDAAKGYFIVTGPNSGPDAPELTVDVNVAPGPGGLDGNAALGALRVHVTDGAVNPLTKKFEHSQLHVQGSVDLVEPRFNAAAFNPKYRATTNRLYVTEIQQGSDDWKKYFKPTFRADGGIHMHVNSDPSLQGLFGGADLGFLGQALEPPKLEFDFNVTGTATLVKLPLRDPEIRKDLTNLSFDNIKMDIGGMLDGIVKPVANVLGSALGPITNIIGDGADGASDFLHARLPLVSDIVGHDVNLIELSGGVLGLVDPVIQGIGGLAKGTKAITDFMANYNGQPIPLGSWVWVNLIEKFVPREALDVLDSNLNMTFTVSLPDLVLPALKLPDIPLPDVHFYDDCIGSVTLTGLKVTGPSVQLQRLQLPDVTVTLSLLSNPELTLSDVQLPDVQVAFTLPDLVVETAQGTFTLQFPRLSGSLHLGNLPWPDLTLASLTPPKLSGNTLTLPSLVLPPIVLPDLVLPSFNITVVGPCGGVHSLGMQFAPIPLPSFDSLVLPLGSVGLPTGSLTFNVSLPDLKLPDLHLQEPIPLPDISIDAPCLGSLTLSGLSVQGADIHFNSLTLPDFTVTLALTPLPKFTFSVLQLPDVDFTFQLPNLTVETINGIITLQFPELHGALHLGSLPIPELLMGSISDLQLHGNILTLPTITLPMITLPYLGLPAFDATFVDPCGDAHTVNLSVDPIPLPAISQLQLPLGDVTLPGGSLTFTLDLPSVTLPQLPLPEIPLGDITFSDECIGNVTLSGIKVKPLDIQLQSIQLPKATLTLSILGLRVTDIRLPDVDFTVQLPDITVETINGIFRLQFPALTGSLDLSTLALPDISLGSLSDFQLVGNRLYLPTVTLPSITLPKLGLPGFTLTVVSPCGHSHTATVEAQSIAMPFPMTGVQVPLGSVKIPIINLPSGSLVFRVPLPDLVLPRYQLPDIPIPDLTFSDDCIGSVTLSGIVVHGPSIQLPIVKLPDITVTLSVLSLPSIKVSDLHLPDVSFSFNLPDITVDDIHGTFKLQFPTLYGSISLGSLTAWDLSLGSITMPQLSGGVLTLPTITLPSIILPNLVLPSFSVTVIDPCGDAHSLLVRPDPIPLPPMSGVSIPLGSITLPNVPMPDLELKDVAFSVPNKLQTSGFKLDFLKAQEVVNMLLNRPFKIFEYDLPGFTPPIQIGAGFNLSYSALGVDLFTFRLSAGAGLTLFPTGLVYDSTGLQAMTNAYRTGGTVDWSKLLDGFYIPVPSNGDKLFDVNLSFSGYASVDIKLASCFLDAGFSGDIFLKIIDPNNDGKLRLPEILALTDNFSDPAKLISLFDVGISLGAHLDAGGQVLGFGFKLSDIGLSPNINFNISLSQLFPDYYVTPTPPPKPVEMASETTMNGQRVLRLNAGPYASNRMAGNTDDSQGADIKVTGGNGGIQVSGKDMPEQSYNGTYDYILVVGGDGNDKFDLSGVSGVPVHAYGGGGHDIIKTGSGNDTIEGGAGNNTIDAGGGDNKVVVTGIDNVTAGSGNDNVDFTRAKGGGTFNSSGGNDWVIGSRYDDHFSSSGGTVHFEGRGGNDTMGCSGYLDGGDGNDTITASGGNSTLIGGAGNDVLTGGAGDDVIYGGSGTNLLNGGAGNDVIYGGVGNDQINGGTGDDILYGGLGNQILDGAGGPAAGPGRDKYYGGVGNDTLIAAYGDSWVDGGLGQNTLIVKSRFAPIVVGTISDASLQSPSTGTTPYVNVKSVAMQLGDLGNAVTVNGVTRPFSISSGAGNDQITIARLSSPGAVPIDLGAGDDTVNVRDSQSVLNLTGGSNFSVGNILNIDRVANPVSTTGTLNGNTFSIDGMANINYGGFDFVNINLGPGSDVFNVLNTGGDVLITTIQGGNGYDNFYVHNAATQLRVYGDTNAGDNDGKLDTLHLIIPGDSNTLPTVYDPLNDRMQVSLFKDVRFGIDRLRVDNTSDAGASAAWSYLDGVLSVYTDANANGGLDMGESFKTVVDAGNGTQAAYFDVGMLGQDSLSLEDSVPVNQVISINQPQTTIQEGQDVLSYNSAIALNNGVYPAPTQYTTNRQVTGIASYQGFVYTVSPSPIAVSWASSHLDVYATNVNGTLTPLQALDDTLPMAGLDHLRGAQAVAVSPDGRFVYVASADGIVTFTRDTTTGRVRYQSLLTPPNWLPSPNYADNNNENLYYNPNWEQSTWYMTTLTATNYHLFVSTGYDSQSYGYVQAYSRDAATGALGAATAVSGSNGYYWYTGVASPLAPVVADANETYVIMPSLGGFNYVHIERLTRDTSAAGGAAQLRCVNTNPNYYWWNGYQNGRVGLGSRRPQATGFDNGFGYYGYYVNNNHSAPELAYVVLDNGNTIITPTNNDTDNGFNWNWNWGFNGAPPNTEYDTYHWDSYNSTYLYSGTTGTGNFSVIANRYNFYYGQGTAFNVLDGLVATSPNSFAIVESLPYLQGFLNDPTEYIGYNEFLTANYGNNNYYFNSIQTGAIQPLGGTYGGVPAWSYDAASNQLFIATGANYYTYMGGGGFTEVDNPQMLSNWNGNWNWWQNVHNHSFEAVAQPAPNVGPATIGTTQVGTIIFGFDSKFSTLFSRRVIGGTTTEINGKYMFGIDSNSSIAAGRNYQTVFVSTGEYIQGVPYSNGVISGNNPVINRPWAGQNIGHMAISPGTREFLYATYPGVNYLLDTNWGTDGTLYPAAWYSQGLNRPDHLEFVTTSGGIYLYVGNTGATGANANSIAIFKLNPASETLTYVGNVQNGVGGITGLVNPGQMTSGVLPDGTTMLYVTGRGQNSIVAFRIDPANGRLTYVGTVRQGYKGVRGLTGIHGLALTSDGKYLVATGRSTDTAVVFGVDQKTGKLTFLQRLRDGSDTTQNLSNPQDVIAAGTRILISTGGPGIGLGTFTAFDVAQTLPPPRIATIQYEGIDSLTETSADGGDSITVRDVGMPLTVNGRDGGDQVTILSTSPNQPTTINVGGGGAIVNVLDTGIGSTVQINGTSGDNTFNVWNTQPDGSLAIDGGPGSSTFNVAGWSPDYTRLQTPVTLIGDGANDKLIFNAGIKTTTPVAPPNGNGSVVVDGEPYGVTYTGIEKVIVIASPVVKVDDVPDFPEGSGVTLDASLDTNPLDGIIDGTLIPSGSIVTEVAWDIDGDSNFGDSLGFNISLTWDQLMDAGINRLGTYRVAVQVTIQLGNGASAFDVGFAEFSITDTPPSLFLTGSSTINGGSEYQLNLDSSSVSVDLVQKWVVNWGDGTATSTVYGPTAAARHTYANQDPDTDYTIEVTAYDAVSDVTGLGYSASKTITVLYVEPTVLTLTGPGTGTEASSYTLNLSATGANTGSLQYWNILWGDGAFSRVSGAARSAAYTYADNGLYVIRAFAEWADGSLTPVPSVVAVDVANVAPTLIVSGGPAMINEGQRYTLNLSSSDPGADSLIQWMIEWGDGTTSDVMGNTTLLDHVYADDGIFAVRVRATDEDGTYPGLQDWQAGPVVLVNNLSPTVTLAGTASVNEGGTYDLDFSARDPGTDNISRYFIEWGDGTTSQVRGDQSQASHVYQRPQSAAIHVTAFDEDSPITGYSVSKNIQVQDLLPAPTVMGSPAGAAEGSAYTITLAANEPGLNPVDSWTVIWGDGTSDFIPASTSNDIRLQLLGSKAILSVDGAYKARFDYGGSLLGITDTNATAGVTISNLTTTNQGGSATIDFGTAANLGEGFVLFDVTSATNYKYAGVRNLGGRRQWVIGHVNANGAHDDAVVTEGVTQQATHIYTNNRPGNAPYAVTATAHQGASNYSAAPLSVPVYDVNPKAAVTGAPQMDARGPFSLNIGPVADPGSDTITEYRVQWGDGSTESFTSGSTKTHVFADAATRHDVVVSVVDGDGVHGVGAVTVVQEGATYTTTLKPLTGNLAGLTYRVAWGDGQSSTYNSSTPLTNGLIAVTHTYGDNGAYAIQVFTVDAQGNQSLLTTQPVVISNVAPAVTMAGAPDSGLEGIALSLDGTITDPGFADVAAGFTKSWNVTKNGVAFTSGSGLNFALVADDDGIYVISLTVTDKDGASNSATKTIAISNVAPTVAINGAPASSLEGTTINLDSTITDPSPIDTAAGFTKSWSVTKNGAAYASGSDGSFSFTPDDQGTYVVTLTVSDKDGGTSSDTKTITVTNAVPSPTILGAPASSPEATAINLDSTVTDPSPLDSAAGFAKSWSVTKNGAAYVSGSGANFSFTPDDNGTYVVTLTATDKDGGVASTSKSITVTNVAPTPTILGAPASGPEGTAISVGSTVTDPSPLDTAAGFTKNWSVTKNGAAYASGSGANFSFTPDDNGTYVVTLTATDKDGGATSVSTTITVTNVGPTASITKMTQPIALFIAPRQTLTFYGAYIDTGIRDTQTVTWIWGDGTSTTSTVGAGGAGSFSATHAYAASGTYTVTLKVMDKDGAVATSQFTVVVQTPQDATGKLMTRVEGLAQLNNGERNALLASLRAAVASMDRGNMTAAANQLGAFINKVKALQQSGRLSTAEAQLLTDMANAIIGAL